MHFLVQLCGQTSMVTKSNIISFRMKRRFFLFIQTQTIWKPSDQWKNDFKISYNLKISPFLCVCFSNVSNRSVNDVFKVSMMINYLWNQLIYFVEKNIFTTWTTSLLSFVVLCSLGFRKLMCAHSLVLLFPSCCGYPTLMPRSR